MNRFLIRLANFIRNFFKPNIGFVGVFQALKRLFQNLKVIQMK